MLFGDCVFRCISIFSIYSCYIMYYFVQVTYFMIWWPFNVGRYPVRTRLPTIRNPFELFIPFMVVWKDRVGKEWTALPVFHSHVLNESLFDWFASIFASFNTTTPTWYYLGGTCPANRFRTSSMEVRREVVIIPFRKRDDEEAIKRTTWSSWSHIWTVPPLNFSLRGLIPTVLSRLK